MARLEGGGLGGALPAKKIAFTRAEGLKVATGALTAGAMLGEAER